MVVMLVTSHVALASLLSRYDVCVCSVEFPSSIRCDITRTFCSGFYRCQCACGTWGVRAEQRDKCVGDL